MRPDSVEVHFSSKNSTLISLLKLNKPLNKLGTLIALSDIIF